ncbi:MAG: DUF885 domain-containing protein [Bacteroidia bacterium]|nr:DUF885 domain-containing protein [Bacteroidia bacterium]
MKNTFFSLLIFFFYGQAFSQNIAFQNLCNDFLKGYQALDIPATGLDYKENFASIKNAEELKKQEVFFTGIRTKLDTKNKQEFSKEEALRFKQLNYETSMNLERIELEKKWNEAGRKIPEGGLFKNKDWYKHYVKHFTSRNISPEEIHVFGKTEVKKIQKQIDSVRILLKFKNEKEFYAHLQNDTFFLKDKTSILNAYKKIDSTVRKNVTKLFSLFGIPEIAVMEWPDANVNTPPGMYLNKDQNPYGKDVFQYNFYGTKHSKRAMEWLYMHEGIPGHHFQSIFRNTFKGDSLQNRFFYFGSVEGWACYIEEYGKEMGLYQSTYSYLGKLQWDLVRSSRLVMETGIHYYGWSREEALKYWKENIKGQDEIAEREVTRITNWPAQSLCYKIGAMSIQKIIKKSKLNLKDAHQFVLQHCDFPLEVLL